MYMYVLQCMHVHIWMWFVVINFGWGVEALNQITVQEEISKAKTFALFHPIPFVWNSKSYSRNWETGMTKRSKRRRDDRKVCKPHGRKFGMDINSVLFYYTKATKLNSLWKCLLYSEPITLGNELRIYDLIPLSFKSSIFKRKTKWSDKDSAAQRTWTEDHSLKNLRPIHLGYLWVDQCRWKKNRWNPFNDRHGVY